MIRHIALPTNLIQDSEEAIANYVLTQIGVIENAESNKAICPSGVHQYDREITTARGRISGALNVAGTVFRLSAYDIRQRVIDECVKAMKLKEERDFKDGVSKEVDRLMGV